MRRLLPFETLDNAAAILNELGDMPSRAKRWTPTRFLADAINGDINLTILLPETFSVDRKDGGERYGDTPLRPSAPKGATHFFADKPELLALSLVGSTELKRIVSVSNEGVRSVLHSSIPPMTVSVSDLLITSQQLFRYIEAERPPVPATSTRIYKSRTNSLDAPIQLAIKLANSLDTSAVFIRLRELALQEEPPFNGQVREDGALCYTADKVALAALTKDGLAKRLKKHSL